MENASKALIMAGSILMSMLVIGTVILLYNQISSLEQTKSETEASAKVVQYLKKFEQYTNTNKTYYGSEILSLANLQEEYNKTQHGENGYQEIEIEVTITGKIEPYFDMGKHTIEEIVTGKKNLENAIGNCETTISGDRSIAYYANKSYKEIALLSGYEYDEIIGKTDGEIELLLQSNSETADLYNRIYEYKLLKSDYTSFKNKKFKLDSVSYDDVTGRIKMLIYSETT